MKAIAVIMMLIYCIPFVRGLRQSYIRYKQRVNKRMGLIRERRQFIKQHGHTLTPEYAGEFFDKYH